MIKDILALLNANEHYAQSESIEIAKGKYQIPTTFKIGVRQIKRNIQWLRKR
jgi:hypothetical protein